MNELIVTMLQQLPDSRWAFEGLDGGVSYVSLGVFTIAWPSALELPGESDVLRLKVPLFGAAFDVDFPEVRERACFDFLIALSYRVSRVLDVPWNSLITSAIRDEVAFKAKIKELDPLLCDVLLAPQTQELRQRYMISTE